MSESFLSMVRSANFGISNLSALALLCALGMWLFLTCSTSGRNLYAAGNNPSAATYIGVNVGRTQCLAFTLCRAIAGLCGYLWAARYAVAYTDTANGFELTVIAACVIGGVSIIGGIGSVLGLLLGCLFLGVIKNALPLLGVSPFWQTAISGVVILSAVIVNAAQTTRTRQKILEEPASSKVYCLLRQDRCCAAIALAAALATTRALGNHSGAGAAGRLCVERQPVTVLPRHQHTLGCHLQLH